MKDTKTLCVIGLVLITLSLWFRQSYEITLIQGDCMTPTFQNNDFAIVREVDSPNNLNVGDIVMARDPLDFLVFKRIARKELRNGDFYFYLLGDNPDLSADSRSWGWINGWRIRGILAYPREGK